MEPHGVLAARLARVRQSVVDAADAASRSADELTLIVVTKFHPAETVRELYDLGVRDFGENRHQEAVFKAAELSDLPGINWHFVGQLQSKKARQVATYASTIHSVDRESVVTALARRDAGDASSDVNTVDCFVQINLTNDQQRGGASEADVRPLVERILSEPSLRLRGVMAVAPLDEDPRRAFSRLRSLSADVRALAPRATAVSAGMRHDFAQAIAEGATHLRIGTAITGNRPEGG